MEPVLERAQGYKMGKEDKFKDHVLELRKK
jgi:hypothetical protein